jgi:hypothetical protein
LRRKELEHELKPPDSQDERGICVQRAGQEKLLRYLEEAEMDLPPNTREITFAAF